MFNPLHWVGQFIEFFGDKFRTSLVISSIFVLFVLFHILPVRKNEGFRKTIRRPLMSFGTLLIVYIIYSVAVRIKGDYFFTIDILLFPILCGSLAFLIILIMNKVHVFWRNAFLPICEIPIIALGASISFLCLMWPLTFIGLGSIEMIAVILLLLMLLSLFLGFGNLQKKLRKEKQ